ncbi:MAG: serine hydrolase [Nocardioidaceae bacterium]
MPSPSQSRIRQEAPPPFAGVPGLAERIDELCDEQPFRTHLSVTELGTGGRFDRLGASVVPSASVRKIAIMMATLRAVTRGDLDLDERVTIDGRYRDQVFTGLLQDLSPGLTMSLRDVLTLMITVSDNLSTAHVVERVGLDEVNRFCVDAGLVDTVHRHALIPRLSRDHAADATNSTTPRDQERLQLGILAGAADPVAATRVGCTTELCSLALDILARQKFSDAVPALLPEAATVAHKTGLGWHDVNDVGVVYREGTPLFVIAAFTTRVPLLLADGTPGRHAARQHIARLARMCWDACSAGHTVPVPSTDREDHHG